MKKISQRKTGILICILAAVCILAVSVQVQAASKKVIFAKANGSVKITLEKKDGSWHLTTGKKEKDKQLLASKIVYVKFSKKANFLQDIMHLTKRESWIREEPFMFWIQRSAMYENQLSQQPSSIQFFLHMGRSGKHGFCKGCRNDPGADLQGKMRICQIFQRNAESASASDKNMEDPGRTSVRSKMRE